MYNYDGSHIMLAKALLYVFLVLLCLLIGYLLNWQAFFLPIILPLGVWFIPKRKN